MPKVGERDGTPFVGIVERMDIEVASESVEHKHAFAFGLLSSFLVSEFPLLHLNAILASQDLESLEIGEVFDFHDEVNRATALAATEAFEDVASGVDVEGGSLLVMEGTESDEVGASLAQGDVVRDDFFDFSRRFDALYGESVDHSCPASTRLMTRSVMRSLSDPSYSSLRLARKMRATPCQNMALTLPR